ncbi:helix-turn-helix domain-containing protein [Bradyrhizobium sp. 6(2017)]|uniref:helix-turn-helix domain-containing protein n=1 Tax=Bradyrhizobium sp. 6(2017) TaxID=1197460 RepID=UPI001FF05E25|nr:helix-turn-helix domain-containing protein [Bradyrhizobium sp. 6(2017)]
MPIKVLHSADRRLDALANKCVYSSALKFGKGTELFRERGEAEYAYQVICGAVRTYRLLSDGRRQINSFHLVGDIFGLENGATHRFTADAIVDTEVRVIRRRSLLDAMTNEDGGVNNLLGLITLNLVHAENHMVLLGRKNAFEKVATFLLEMDQRQAQPDKIHLPMSRRDIADYLGLKLETVSRALSKMRDERMLRIDGVRAGNSS